MGNRATYSIALLTSLVIGGMLIKHLFQSRHTAHQTGGAMNNQNKQWAFGARSLRKLSTVHEDLQRVAHRALELSPFDFGITSGSRSAEEQNALFTQGASQLDGYARKSRHQTGHAIDFAVYDENGNITWDFSYFMQVSWAFKQAARELNIPIIWGGDWVSFKDGPHVELDKAVYP